MKKRIFAGICAAICLFLLTGCRKNGFLVPAAAENGFTAEVSGSMNGVPFSAVVTHAPTSDRERVTVCYLTPPSLAGIEVALSPDGTASARLGGVEIGGGELLADAWSEPARLFFPSGAYESVTEGEGIFTFCYPDGAVLVLDGEGTPVSAARAGISFSVVWLEWETKK